MFPTARPPALSIRIKTELPEIAFLCYRQSTATTQLQRWCHSTKSNKGVFLWGDGGTEINLVYSTGSWAVALIRVTGLALCQYTSQRVWQGGTPSCWHCYKRNSETTPPLSREHNYLLLGALPCARTKALNCHWHRIYLTWAVCSARSKKKDCCHPYPNSQTGLLN